MNRYYKTLILTFVLMIFQNKVFSQNSRPQKNTWGISIARLLTLVEVAPFKTGTGNEVSVWYQQRLNEKQTLMLSLGFRNQIGYTINATHATVYNYPTIQMQVLEDAKLTALRYLNLEIGLKKQAKITDFSWGAGVFLSNLIGIKGGRVEKTWYRSIEVSPYSNSQFIRLGDRLLKVLNKKNFNRIDIGLQTQLYYQITPRLVFQMTGRHGLIKVFKTSFLGTSVPFYNRFVSLGCLVQIH